MVWGKPKFSFAIVFALAAALMCPVAAFADRGPVENNVSFKGTVLKGKSEAQVRALVGQKPAITAVVVRGNGKTVKWAADKAKGAVTPNVAKMVDQAYRSNISTITPYAITPVYSVDKKAVKAWTKGTVAKKLDRKAVNAKRYVKSRKLKVKAEKKGYKVGQPVTAARIEARLLAEAKGGKPYEVWADAKTIKPKVTRKNIGKAILVVLKSRTVYLYNKTKVQKKYRCAIGTRSYPTPTGTFKIVAKRNRPTWVNPAPNGWGRNMPARIGPGTSNPLGLRALNLNASGIRIHGTNKLSSIGTAASHGCVRLTNKNVVDLYKRVKVGTPVYIVK